MHRSWWKKFMRLLKILHRYPRNVIGFHFRFGIIRFFFFFFCISPKTIHRIVLLCCSDSEAIYYAGVGLHSTFHWPRSKRNYVNFCWFPNEILSFCFVCHFLRLNLVQTTWDFKIDCVKPCVGFSILFNFYTVICHVFSQKKYKDEWCSLCTEKTVTIDVENDSI